MYKTNRQYPTFPIPGVAAIIIHENKVLVVKRQNEPSKGKWGLPGGVVNIGETTNEAIIREVFEETSIKVKPIKLFKVLDSITRDDENKIKYHYILLEFLCEYESGDVVSSSDAVNAAWIPLATLNSIEITSITKNLIKKVLEEEPLV